MEEIDYAEQMFKAMDIIITEKLKNISFDVTKICTIIDDSNKDKKGYYLVTDGNIKFEAYSETTKYKKDDIVRVTIPNGDYNGKKFIESKYTTDSNTPPISYISPTDQIVEVGEKIIFPASTASIKTNDEKKEKRILFRTFDTPLKITAIQNTIILKAEFQCLLSEYDIRSGNYGLRVDLYSSTEKESQYEKKQIFLDSSEMYGDPYSFVIGSMQEKVVDAGDISSISLIEIYLYQNQDFTYYDSFKIKTLNADVFPFDNILVKNIELSFGSNVQSFEDKQLLLYTNDSPGYTMEEELSNNQKNIGIVWYNKDNQNNFIGFNDGIYDTEYDEIEYLISEKNETDSNKYCIYWYRYEPGYYDSEEPFLERGWQRLKEVKNFGLPKEFEIKNDGIKYYTKLPKAEDAILLQNLNRDKMIQKYRAILFFNHQRYESNIIEFTNESNALDNLPPSVLNSIEIIHKENSQENYQLYGVNNYLLNKAEKYKKRYLSINYFKEDIKTDIPAEAKVLWYFPKTATMLSYNENELSAIGVLKNTDENLLREGFECFSSSKLDFIYHIKDYYNLNSKNNIIHCVLKIGENSFETKISFTFSTFGTNGSKYSLVAMPENEFSSIVNTENDLVLNIKLYDYNSKEIGFDNLTCEWIGPSSYNYSIDQTKKQIIINKKSEENSYLGTLKIKVFSLENEELSILFPISYSNNEKNYIEGADTIIYNSLGVDPSFYQNEYRIFNIENGEQTNVTWSIMAYDSEGNVIEDSAYIPKIENNILIPYTFYIGNINEFNIVYCKDEDDLIIYAQPIIIIQNRYSSNMLNEWNGNFELNEENGTIMSTLLGAGKKNEDNSFSGILFGDVEGAIAENGTGIGLYGFHNGAQSFAFLNNGTGFIGKSGRGRIIFDGEKGQIKSPSVIDGNIATTAMRLDIDQGEIDINSQSLIDPRARSIEKLGIIHLGMKSPYFSIGIKDSKDLVYIGDNDYFLQSEDFSESNRKGLKLDLKEGKLVGYNFDIRAGSISGANISIGNGRFNVDIKGNLTATNASISGNLIIPSGNSLSFQNKNGTKAILSATEYEGETDGLRCEGYFELSKSLFVDGLGTFGDGIAVGGGGSFSKKVSIDSGGLEVSGGLISAGGTMKFKTTEGITFNTSGGSAVHFDQYPTATNNYLDGNYSEYGDGNRVAIKGWVREYVAENAGVNAGITNSINSLQSQVDTLSSNFSNLETSVNFLKTDLSKFQSSTIEDIVKLTGRVNALEGK